MNLVTQVKSFILWCLRPLERRGIQFTMRCKLLPKQVVSEIAEYRKKSFCPFAHFDVVYKALQYLDYNCIQGDIVLCGVAKGGLAKFMLKYMGGYRTLWLYDTFDGGSLPGDMDSEHDRIIGEHVKRVMSTDAVTVNQYVEDGSGRCKWIIGDVMHTIPDRMPEKIALLYLDTDWYASTFHELNHMEPRVVRRGVIIQDDMGLCVGAAKAVKDYYGHTEDPFIVPMDEAGSVWVKS